MSVPEKIIISVDFPSYTKDQRQTNICRAIYSLLSSSMEPYDDINCRELTLHWSLMICSKAL